MYVKICFVMRLALTLRALPLRSISRVTLLRGYDAKTLRLRLNLMH